jgi:hypothetical protein
MKKRILFIIDSDLYIRNYIDTGVIDFLNKNYKLFLVANDKLINKKKIVKLSSFYGFYSYSKNDINLINSVLRQKLWEKKNLSKSIKFKLRYHLRFLKFFEEDINIFFILKLPKLILSYFRNILLYFYDTSFLFSYFRKCQESRIKINNDLQNFFLKTDPDLVLYPNSGENISKYCISKLTGIFDTKILLLIDNWDNLSSKSAISKKNFYYGVWGEQTKQHAIKIQNIKRNKVFPIGTPRYENYFFKRKKNIKTFFDFKYVLFLESSARYTAETDMLFNLDNIFSNNQNFNKYKIIYRPHPWRPITKLINFSSFKNIILDPQVEDVYKKKLFTKYVLPDLEYYPSLIKNAEFIISGPTTMVIESLIFYKVILLLNFSLKNNFYNPRNILENSNHFDGIQKFDSIIFNNNLNELEKNIEHSFILKNKINKTIESIIDKKLKYYLYKNSKSYNERLKVLVDKLS